MVERTGTEQLPEQVVLKILEDFNWKGVEMRWPFINREGHRMFATINANDLASIIKIEDWDAIQDG